MSERQSRGAQKNYPKKPASPRIKRLCQGWRDYQWQVVLVMFAISFSLGYIGFYKYTRSIGEAYSPTDLLYLTLQLTALESGAVSGPVSWELEVARWLTPLVTAYTAILAAAMLFRKQLQMIRLWYLRRHIIICGLGEKGWLLATNLRLSGQNVVVIEKESGNFRNDLCREKGIIVLEGDATDLPMLRKSAVQRASHLVSVCGDDGVNAEVAMAARQLSQERNNNALNCTIHLTNPHLCDLLREQEFGFEAFPTFRLEMFNIFEQGARILLSEHSPFDQGEEEHGSAGPHILIVGLGRFGESLLIQSARRWYEANGKDAGLLRISMVDPRAEEKAKRLRGKFPKLPYCCDLVPLQLDLDNSQFQNAAYLSDASGRCDVSSIFICLRDQTLGLQSALTLRQNINCNQLPIVVRMQEDSGLAKLLTGGDKSQMSFHNVVPFGLLQRTCTPELVLGGTHEILAQSVHENYLQRRLEEGLQMGEKRSMAHWYELPPDLRESNLRQVDHIRLKLHAAGYGIKPLSDWEAASYRFSDSEVEKMAEIEHEHWMQERKRNGWRFAPGPEDAKQKTHPDLLPWNRLPETVKDKDRQPTIALPALLARAGFQVYKLSEKHPGPGIEP